MFLVFHLEAFLYNLHVCMIAPLEILFDFAHSLRPFETIPIQKQYRGEHKPSSEPNSALLAKLVNSNSIINSRFQAKDWSHIQDEFRDQ